MAGTGNLGTEWIALLEKLKEKYPALKKKDLKYTPGKEEELMQKIGQTLSINRDEVSSLIIKTRAEYHAAGKAQGEGQERRRRSDPEHPNEPEPDITPDITG